MASYYVDMIAQPNDEHEIHIGFCNRLPSIQNRIFLGDFLSCRRAITEAEKYYPQVNGCHCCCSACHTE